MYSPGAPNFTAVEAFPSASGVGRAFSKVTAPGPLNLLHAKGPPNAPRPRTGLSSLTHTVRGSGSASLAVKDWAIPCGGPENDEPFAENFSTGGVFPLPAS